MQTILEPQADLSALFEQARRDGEVRIQRADGEVFVLRAESNKRSPLDVDGVDLGISADEIVEFYSRKQKASEIAATAIWTTPI